MSPPRPAPKIAHYKLAPVTTPTAPLHYRSKTLAAWLALTLGSVGAHRIYLHGWRDPWAWLFLPPTALGLLGVWRANHLGQDDHLAWLLIPLLGLALSAAMLNAIVLALTPDEIWDARFNPGQPEHATGWGAVTAAIAALLVGAAVLMGTVAFSGQRYFEWEFEAPASQNTKRLMP